MSEDWGAQAIIDAFPREGKTYFVQFVTEPVLVHKEAQGGRKYTSLEIRVQFFALNDVGEYHYLGWGEKHVSPCVLEDLLDYGHIFMTTMFEVVGTEHKKHVDLEVVKAHSRQSASDGMTKPVPTSQPSKLGDIGAPAPVSNPATICKAHAILKCPSCHPEEWGPDV